MYVSSFLAVLLCPPPHRSAMCNCAIYTHTLLHHHATEGEQRWVVVVLQYPGGCSSLLASLGAGHEEKEQRGKRRDARRESRDEREQR